MTADREALVAEVARIVRATVAELVPAKMTTPDEHGISWGIEDTDAVDRWTAHLADALAVLLAAREQQARAAALREAAEEIGEGDGISRFIGMDPMPEAVRAEKRAQQWLRDRADRIEADA